MATRGEKVSDEIRSRGEPPHERAARRGSFLEVFRVFARLGLLSFGGPIAHLGYFREEVVVRRKWLAEGAYADLIALCQSLPGPSSSQMGIALGLTRAGIPGGIAAWLGFTLPSAILLTLFAYVTAALDTTAEFVWLHGLLVVAVAVVAQAVLGMARSFCTDTPRATMAILSSIALLLWPQSTVQIGVIVVAGLIGWGFLRGSGGQPAAPMAVPIGRRVAVASLIVFPLLLLGLPILDGAVGEQALSLFDSFFRVGSLVFGGGHVVLPLLQQAVVPPGWVSNSQFLAGYAAAQAVPGPLFTFSAYLGALSAPAPHGWLGALIALVAIFLPSFLLVIGILPFWSRLRVLEPFQAALRGINAAVVGLLVAALYHPIWTSAIHTPFDLALALLDFGLLVVWKLPAWSVVLVSAAGGALLHLL